MSKVTLLPLVKGAEALPKTAELVGTTETSLTIEYNEMYNGALLTHVTTIPRSAVAFTQLKPVANNDVPPVSKLVAPAAAQPKPAAPVAPAPVAPAPTPVVAAAPAPTPPPPVDGPKKRGPKPKPRDANGNIIREATPTLAPPATTPAPPARPGAEIKKKRAVVQDPEPEFVPEEAAPAPRPKAEKTKPVSKYRPTLAPPEPEDADDGVDLDDADLADADIDVDDAAEVEPTSDEDPEFDF
jgi:hypothetical protein